MSRHRPLKRWNLWGTSRAVGAIGEPEAFAVQNFGYDRADAEETCRKNRYAHGREHVLITRVEEVR